MFLNFVASDISIKNNWAEAVKQACCRIIKIKANLKEYDVDRWWILFGNDWIIDLTVDCFNPNL